MAVMERIPGLVFAELREEVQERCCALRTQVLSTHSQEESKDSKEKVCCCQVGGFFLGGGGGGKCSHTCSQINTCMLTNKYVRYVHMI